MKFRIFALLALLALGVGAAGAQEERVLHFGAALPLSGEYATYGKLIQDGIELAREDLEEDGVRLRLSYEDVALPGRAALTAIRKLVVTQEIDALAGNFWNPAIPIMAPLLNRHHVPAFHTAAADDLILDAGDYIFSTNAKVRDEAHMLAEYAYEDLNARRVGAAFIGTTFGEQYAEHFRSFFTRLGGSVVSYDMTLLDSVDNRAVLSRIKAAKPDVIFAAHFGANLGRFLKQAREVGMTQKILSVYEAEDPSVLAAAGGCTEDLLFFVAEPAAASADIESFLKHFHKRFGYRPGVLGRNAYDATRLLAFAFDHCRNLEGRALQGACVKERLYQVRSYSGMSGQFSIERDGAAKKPFVLKTVENGQFVPYIPESVCTQELSSAVQESSSSPHKIPSFNAHS